MEEWEENAECWEMCPVRCVAPFSHDRVNRTRILLPFSSLNT